MKSQTTTVTNFNIVDRLNLEEIPPSQSEKIVGGFGLAINTSQVLGKVKPVVGSDDSLWLCKEDYEAGESSCIPFPS